jgi:carbon storage regulator
LDAGGKSSLEQEYGTTEPNLGMAGVVSSEVRLVLWMGQTAIQRNDFMLVLSRKKNESIVINNDITIVVVEIRGDKVRLGVEAPKEVPVHRREVYDAIKRTEGMQNEQVPHPAGESVTDT